MWTIIENVRGLPSRKVPAIKRLKGTGRVELILPRDFVTGPRADVFRAEDGRIGFLMGQSGAYAVRTPTRGACCSIQIPAQIAPPVAVGMTDVTLARDGDMLILDPATLPAVDWRDGI